MWIAYTHIADENKKEKKIKARKLEMVIVCVCAAFFSSLLIPVCLIGAPDSSSSFKQSL